MNSLVEETQTQWSNISESLNKLHSFEVFFNKLTNEKHEKVLFPQLKKTAETFNKVHVISIKPTISPELTNRVLKNLPRINELGLNRKEIRHLCWVPQVSFNPEFVDLIKNWCVEKKERHPPSGWLNGLISAYHQFWKRPSSKAQKLLQDSLRAWLSNYNGQNKRLQKYKDNVKISIGDDAAERMAALIWSHKELPEKISDEYYVFEDSNFMKLAVRDALNTGLEKKQSRENLNFIFQLLNWQYLEKDDLKTCTSNLILSSPTEENRRLIQDFVLANENFGDPRRPSNRSKWIKMDKAKAQLIQWLSKEDIEWFFDVIMEGRDRHGRKNFWLDYVPNIEASRVILSSDDYYRVKSATNNNLKKNRDYARFSPTASSTSAFVLFFPRLVAVEFSEVGNACYLYTRQDFDAMFIDFWSREFSSPAKLKEKNRNCHRQIHDQYGYWKGELSSALAKFGVR